MTVRIDSHQHFWRPARGDYGWLTPELTVLYRDYMPRDLEPLLEQNDVQKSVLIQAAPTTEETYFMLRLAARNGFVAGVVGWVDMEDSGESLEVLEELSTIDKFLGVRPMIQDIADPDWMLRPELDAVFRKLIELDLRFDALVLPVHLSNLIELLKRYPELKLVVDHGGKPDIDAGAMQPWADDMSAIAGQSGAFCKLSGLITETAETQSYEDVWPYCDHLLQCFGADRLMWGSDWPVLNLRGDYNGWHTSFTEWLSPLSDAEREAILGATATRFYALSTES